MRRISNKITILALICMIGMTLCGCGGESLPIEGKWTCVDFICGPGTNYSSDVETSMTIKGEEVKFQSGSITTEGTLSEVSSGEEYTLYSYTDPDQFKQDGDSRELILMDDTVYLVRLYSHSSSSSSINGEMVSESSDTNYTFLVFTKDKDGWEEMTDSDKSAKYDELKAILQQ